MIWGKIIDRVASHNRKQPKHLGVLPKKQLSSSFQPIPSRQAVRRSMGQYRSVVIRYRDYRIHFQIVIDQRRWNLGQVTCRAPGLRRMALGRVVPAASLSRWALLAGFGPLKAWFIKPINPLPSNSTRRDCRLSKSL